MLLASSFAEVKRRGSITSGLQFNANSINKLVTELRQRRVGTVELEAVSLRQSDTADPVVIVMQIKQDGLKEYLDWSYE